MCAQDIICYELRSFFHNSPNLLNCPICGSALEVREVSPSAAGKVFSQRASIPVVETCLHTCPGCGWWAVREMRSDCEINDGIGDYLILPERWKVNHTAGEGQHAEWSSALVDIDAYEEAIPISSPAARDLFGSVQASLKKLPCQPGNCAALQTNSQKPKK